MNFSDIVSLFKPDSESNPQTIFDQLRPTYNKYAYRNYSDNSRVMYDRTLGSILRSYHLDRVASFEVTTDMLPPELSVNDADDGFIGALQSAIATHLKFSRKPYVLTGEDACKLLMYYPRYCLGKAWADMLEAAAEI